MTSIGAQRGTVNTTRVGEAASALRAAVNLRVSTGRQAEQELSIPDQKDKLGLGVQRAAGAWWLNTSSLVRLQPTTSDPSSKR